MQKPFTSHLNLQYPSDSSFLFQLGLRIEDIMVFGQYEFICKRAALPLCALVGPYTTNNGQVVLSTGVFPECFARSIDLANTIIFQIGNSFINIIALGVLALMIFNIRTKFTAIGRKEILDFFGMYLFLTALSLITDSGIAPPGSPGFAYFVAIQSGCVSACCWCLMINGLLGFQLWEDGTPRSIWFLRFSCLGEFTLTFVIAIITFKGWGGSAFSPTNTTGLFVVLYLFNIFFISVYVISQMILTVFILQDFWSFGAVTLGTIFFTVGQVMLYVFSQDICNSVKHYLDGLFFASLTNLFASMMIYKYWDMITTEDLEFSVSNKESAWEVRELLEEDGGYNESKYSGYVYPFKYQTY